MKRLLSRWLPVLAWMGLIFFGSAQSSLPQIGTPLVQLVLRKAGHLLEYLVLALLLVRAQGKYANCRWRTYGTVFLAAVAYAASDEFHQSFVALRSPEITDVAIDSAGAAVGLVILGLRTRQ